jgi:hypothetical protein
MHRNLAATNYNVINFGPHWLERRRYENETLAKNFCRKSGSTVPTMGDRGFDLFVYGF